MRLLETNRFLLQLAYGSMQVSELALGQIWLTGFAAMGAVNAYLGSLIIASSLPGPTSLAAWRAPAMARSGKLPSARSSRRDQR